MITFNEAWEREVEKQRKDYFDRVGYHSKGSPPLRFNTKPSTIPRPVMTQAWGELSGMSRIIAQENYARSVKAQQDMYSGKTHKRFMAAIEKLERFRG
jgi:hypothetical protein